MSKLFADKKSTNPIAQKSKAPLVHDLLAKIMDRNKKKLPEGMPTKVYDAAYWWMDLQEPPDDRLEQVVKIADGKNGSGWITPYHDRVAYTLRIFLGLDAVQQAFIIHHSKQKIYWRGDGIKLYSIICREHEKMLQAPGKYIGNAKQMLKAFQG